MEVTEVKKAVRRKVNETLDIAERVYRRKFKAPTIVYALKGSIAGTATYSNWTVNLNAFFLLNEFEEMIRTTIPHEIAHLIARAVYGNIRSHGWEWKSVMRSFGLNAKRCHNYESRDIRTKKTRRFHYTCFCSRPCKVGLNVHKKVQSRNSHFCVKCKKALSTCEWEEA